MKSTQCPVVLTTAVTAGVTAIHRQDDTHPVSNCQHQITKGI